jgi:hypothetical protein
VEEKPDKQFDEQGIRTFARDAEKAIKNGSDSDVVFSGVAAPQKQVSAAAPEKSTSDDDDSILSNKDDIFDVSRAFDSHVEVGTIVTDKRRKKRSFLSTLKEAFDEWYGDIEGTVEEQVKKFEKPPVPKIIKPEHRKATIQAAGKNVIQRPADDHTVVIEKLRSHGRQHASPQTKKKYELKPKQEEKVPTWTHLDEPDQADHKNNIPVAQTTNTPVIAPTVEATQVPKKNEDHSKKVEHLPGAPTQIPVPSAKLHAEPAKAIVDTPISTYDEVEKEDTKKIGWSSFKNTGSGQEQDDVVLTTTPTAREDESKKSEPYVHIDLPKVERPTPVQTTQPIQKRYVSESSAAAQRTNKQTWFLISGIALAVVIGMGTGVSLYIASMVPEEQASRTISIPTLVPADVVLSIPLPNDKAALFKNMMGTFTSTNERIIQTYPTIPDSDQTPATTQEIFSVIDPNAPGSFIRSLDAKMMIGALKQGDTTSPFVILQTDSFEAAFAGMLAWEPGMQGDLAPLFTKTGTNAFVDRAIENHNVRTKEDPAGKTILIYAFVDQSTILITDSEAALLELISMF